MFRQLREEALFIWGEGYRNDEPILKTFDML